MGTPGGVWGGRGAATFGRGLLLFRVETRPSPEEVGRLGALAHYAVFVDWPSCCAARAP